MRGATSEHRERPVVTSQCAGSIKEKGHGTMSATERRWMRPLLAGLAALTMTACMPKLTPAPVEQAPAAPHTANVWATLRDSMNWDDLSEDDQALKDTIAAMVETLAFAQ